MTSITKNVYTDKLDYKSQKHCDFNGEQIAGTFYKK